MQVRSRRTSLPAMAAVYLSATAAWMRASASSSSWTTSILEACLGADPPTLRTWQGGEEEEEEGAEEEGGGVAYCATGHRESG